jgi:CheY-like chemotaxis protein
MVIGTSILVVEDDDDVLESICELLEESGYQVTATRNGVEALAVLRQMARPAAMLVDSLMAEMSGAEFLRRCAADPELAAIPAIVISAHTHGAIDMPNVRGFVPKPFNVDQLLGAVAGLLRRY